MRMLLNCVLKDPDSFSYHFPDVIKILYVRKEFDRAETLHDILKTI